MLKKRLDKLPEKFRSYLRLRFLGITDSFDRKYFDLFKKYKDFSMVPDRQFMSNLQLCNAFKGIEGSVVECGVWKGGMSAAIAELLGPDRTYFLFDSFEGLPKANYRDGHKAIEWQAKANIDSPGYYNNCSADIGFAKSAMELSGAKKHQLIKGWFNKTIPTFTFPQKIAILRLDADWYDSTITCLESLYNQISPGGVIIIDDYLVWDGCTRAVHDYFSKHDIPARIRETDAHVPYVIKV